MSAKISLVPEREMYYNKKNGKAKKGEFPYAGKWNRTSGLLHRLSELYAVHGKINIPGLFALYNRTATEGVEAVRAEYERQDKRADDCINCYRCEKQCPQHLGIGILMQDIAETFGE